MNFNGISVRILVRKDFGEYFDFCTEKLGLIPVWGDSSGPYASFAMRENEKPCIAIFVGKNTEIWKGYKQPPHTTSPDTIAAIITSSNFEEDYNKLKKQGVEFLDESQFVSGWEMLCVYFRDPEGNLFELNNGEI
ncbi:MAG: VOC family protein [Defluviitaleaceae bacterium]|nr:VOC family protein [Defluviitaleaceae bacterium]